MTTLGHSGTWKAPGALEACGHGEEAFKPGRTPLGLEKGMWLRKK